MTVEATPPHPAGIERGPGRPHRGNYRDAEGRKVPSVTTILDAMDAKQGLQAWRMRQCFDQGYEYGCLQDAHDPTQAQIKAAREKATRDGFRPDSVGREAGYIGSAVHDAIESIIHGDDGIATLDGFGLTAEQHKQAMKALGAWKRWRDENHHLRFVATEIPLISDELGFGGTIDALADDCGRVWLADWKSSSRFYESHVYQIGGYVQLLSDARGIDVDDATIVRCCKKTGRPHVMTIGGQQLKAARMGFVWRLRAFKLDESFRRFYGAQLNPPRRRKVAS